MTLGPRPARCLPRACPLSATLAGCAALLLWAFLALLARLAQPLPPLLLTGLAFAVGGTLGLIVVAARGRLGALRQPPIVWLHGVAGLAGYHALYFAALALAPPVEANLLNYTLAAADRAARGAVARPALGPRRLAGVGLGAPARCCCWRGRRERAGFGGGALLGYALGARAPG